MSDCIIVGAGAIGLLSALALRRRGATVTVIDRQQAGREASWAGGGILCPLYPWRYADAINRLAFWSAERYPSLCDQLAGDTGIDPQWRGSGLLILDPPSPGTVDDWVDRFGQPARTVTAHSLFPPLDDRPAAWLPEVGQVRNPRLLQALKAAALRAGVRVEEGFEARQLLIEGDRVLGLRGERAEYRGERVVIAAGAWSSALLPDMPADAIAPVRGQMLRLQAKVDAVPAILMEKGVYLIPRADGGVVVGSTVEHVGFDRRTTDSARTTLHAEALRIWPALRDAPLTHHWAGLRPGSDNGIPSIGAHPRIRGLYLNTGHYRNGLVMGPASAELLANLIGEEAPIVDPTPHDPALRLTGG